MLTVRKAYHVMRDENRPTPAGGWAPGAEHALAQVPSREPDPAFAAEMAENCQRLLQLLGEPERTVALMKMEGYTNAEIAGHLDYAPRTISSQKGTMQCPHASLVRCQPSRSRSPLPTDASAAGK